MRTPLLASLLVAVLTSGNVHAQSLEESYAKLCSDPAKAKSEACRILAESLVAKLQGQHSPQAGSSTNAGHDPAAQSLWRKRLGDTVEMIGTERFTVAVSPVSVEQKLSFLSMRYKSEWKIPGQEIEYSVMMPDGTWQSQGSMRWDEPTQRFASTTAQPYTVVAWGADADGSFRTETIYAGVTSRSTTFKVAEQRFQTVVEKLEAGTWVEISRTDSVEYSPERVALEWEKIQLAQKQYAQQLAQSQQDERDAKRAASQQRAGMFNALLQGVAQGVSETSTGGYAEAQANLDATVANIQYAAAVERQPQSSPQRTGQEPVRLPQPQQVPAPGTSPSPAPASQNIAGQDIAGPGTRPAASPPAQHESEPVAGKELRFVMSISLRNQPGDKFNPTCYSNIISRPGPPGWGAPGFLPRGSAEQAHEAVYSLKSAFIAQCRASGREITSDGNFNFQLNQSQGDEERLQGMRARHSEDVSVSL